LRKIARKLLERARRQPKISPYGKNISHRTIPKEAEIQVARRSTLFPMWT